MMNRPALSIVIPAYNEEACLAASIEQVVAQLESMKISWEVLVVNDGSTDRTAAVAAAWSRREPRVRLIDLPHAGKGSAVRRGMLEAAGEWRFLADADLSMPIAHLARFFDPAAGLPATPIAIGSREALGSRRLQEPWPRHAIGRVFNAAVRLLLVPRIQDTQCGFKLFSRDAAETLFWLQRLDGFGFDVEVLALARRMGYGVREVPIDWRWARGSKVTLAGGAAAFLDIVRIRWNLLRGAYGDLARPAATETNAPIVRHGSVDA